jgi:integrase
MAATRRLPQPWRHPTTGVYYLRRHYPKHLRHLLGQEARRSLGTLNLQEARRLYPAMAAKVQQEIDKAQSEYDARKELDRQAAETDAQADQEAIFLASLTPSQRDLWYRTQWSKAHGLPVNLTPAEGLDAYLAGGLNHTPKSGDTVRNDNSYRNSDHLDVKPHSQVTFDALVDAWAAERRPDARSVAAWRLKVAGKFAEWLGHDDASKVTKADVLRYRDHLLAAGRAPKTVADAIVQIRVLYRAAIDSDRLVMTNPAEGVKVRAKQSALEKVRPYSHEEADKVLELARGKTEGNTLRWLPALLAWTGARLEELAGLRVRDVQEEKNVNGSLSGWYVDLVDHQARPLKTSSSVRKVPLVGAVCEREGFIEGFLGRREGASPDDLLFQDLTLDAHGRLGPNLSKRLSHLVKVKADIADPRLQPAHGFRHRFTELLREAGVDAPIRDAILGHTTPGLGARYGSGFSLAVLRKAIEAVEGLSR